jgi:acryloyl-coenzyme A reductase
MKAMVVRQPGGLDAMRLEQIPEPVAGPKDVVIKVEACGVCFHDVLTRNGTLKAGVKMPCVLGHEISGTVTAIGTEVRNFRTGQRVATAQRYHICGACRFCRSGRETLCAERKFLGDFGMVGGYAIHGYPSVPLYPASHGCIRVPIPQAAGIDRAISLGDTIYVYR